MFLRHCVQSTPILEPFQLGLVESMRQLRLPCFPVLGVDSQRDRFAHRELGAEEIDLVVWIDFVVVGWVAEGEWKHALLLQVCLVLMYRSRVSL